MAVNLFLDANILLSFYALSNADITQLKQLKGVVANGDIRLFISDHLDNEVERNRETKVHESFKAFRNDTFKCHAPSFVKSLPKFEDLQNIINLANKKHAEVVTLVSALVEKRDLDADKIIKELIKAAGLIRTTNEQFSAARKRFLKGDPPGKKKATIGDELNWEFLLDTVPISEDLHFISIDSDYASPNDAKKANSFLAKEWKEKKESELHFYRDLNDFFGLHVPKIKLANQAKLSALISELASSNSFSATHVIIAKFPKESEFNDAQIAELIAIKANNFQVGWVGEDSDVSSFYAPVEQRQEEIAHSAGDAESLS